MLPRLVGCSVLRKEDVIYILVIYICELFMYYVRFIYNYGSYICEILGIKCYDSGSYICESFHIKYYDCESYICENFDIMCYDCGSYISENIDVMCYDSVCEGYVSDSALYFFYKHVSIMCTPALTMSTMSWSVMPESFVCAVSMSIISELGF